VDARTRRENRTLPHHVRKEMRDGDAGFFQSARGPLSRSREVQYAKCGVCSKEKIVGKENKESSRRVEVKDSQARTRKKVGFRGRNCGKKEVLPVRKNV